MRQHNIWCVCVRAFCVEMYAGLQHTSPHRMHIDFLHF